MNQQEIERVLAEWEGDVAELDFKLADGQIPEDDNLDAKMKVELWFALTAALGLLADSQREVEQLRAELADERGEIDAGGRPMTKMENVWMDCQQELSDTRAALRELRVQMLAAKAEARNASDNPSAKVFAGRIQEWADAAERLLEGGKG